MFNVLWHRAVVHTTSNVAEQPEAEGAAGTATELAFTWPGFGAKQWQD